MMISIVIPTYNESAIIGGTLERLSEIITPQDEIIVVDGFSEDNTGEIVGEFPGVRLIVSSRGRAAQMNTGAEIAAGVYLLFLHADVQIDENCLSALKCRIAENGVRWGWFTLKLSSPKFIYRVLEMGANLRNRLTGIPLGDHGIFVKKDAFHQAGGFPEIPVMEDLEFVRRMKLIVKGVEIKSPVQISVRRFERTGILKTIFLMWMLRILYYFGASPERLTKYYGNVR